MDISYYKTILPTAGSYLAFSCPFLVKLVLRFRGDLHWHKSRSSLKGPEVPPAHGLCASCSLRAALPSSAPTACSGWTNRFLSWRTVLDATLPGFFFLSWKSCKQSHLVIFLMPWHPELYYFTRICFPFEEIWFSREASGTPGPQCHLMA